jgi:hypothetical protein
MYGVCEAILAINPSAQVSVNADDVDQIIWHGETEIISKSDIQAKQAELKTIYDSLAYSRSRKEEYNKLCQFELISDDSINGTTTHKDAILAIKNKFPK